MSERAQARLSDCAPPIDAICLANKYVNDEQYTLVSHDQLFAGVLRDREEQEPDMMN